MTLRGSLANFGVADVMAQLGQEARTGALVLRGNDEEVRLLLQQGGVVGAEVRRRRRQELLGTMLMRANLISAEQLEQALARQKASGQRLGDLLVDIGAITADDLQRTARLQTSETVFRAFLWRSGTFEFNDEALSTQPTHPPLQPEGLLMEAFRQADGWPAIRRRLASYTLTFRPLQDLAALAQAPPGRLALGEADWHIAGLIAPDRDVQRLIDLGQIGEFATCQALLNLIDAGLIVIAPARQESPSAQANVGGISAPRADGGMALAPAGLFFVIVVAAWALVVGSGIGPGAPAPGPVGGTGAIASARDAARLAAVVEALAAYRAMTGSYPAKLRSLVERDLLPAAALTGLRYTYATADGRYGLLPPP